MLPKKNTLREKDFSRIFRLGKYYRGKSLIARFTLNNLGENRFGVVISKKVSHKATVRNKIKRQIRAIIAEFSAQLNSSHDLAIIVRPTILDNNFAQIREEVRDMLRACLVVRK